jgi:hypothetical protein
MSGGPRLDLSIFGIRNTRRRVFPYGLPKDAIQFIQFFAEGFFGYLTLNLIRLADILIATAIPCIRPHRRLERRSGQIFPVDSK